MSRQGRVSVFAAICAFSFLVNFGRVGFAPLVEPFMGIFGVREATAGLVATAVWFGSALPRLPTGLLLTRLRRHEVILGQVVLLVTAAAFTALAPSIALVTLGALLVGIATGVFYIAANPLVSELYPDRVGWAVGLRSMASQIAAVAAPIAVGVALAMGSWRLTYGGLAVAAAAVGVWIYRAVGRADLPSAGHDDRDLLAAARAQWRIIATGIAVVSAIAFVWQGIFNFYVSYLVTTKPINADTARILLMAVFAAGVPAIPLAGRLADRMAPLRLVFASAGAFIVALIALVSVTGLVGIAVVSVLMGFSIHAVFPIADTYMLASLPDRHRASAYAVFSASMMLLQAPGSVVLGVLIEGGASYAQVFLTAAAFLSVGLAAMVVLDRVGWLPAGGAR